MATISENIKDGKVISFKIRAFLDRDSNGKQIVSYTTWHVPEGMTINKARKQVQVYAKGWETEQKKVYADKNQERKEEKTADYSFSYIVNNLWFPLTVEHSERKPKTIQSYRYLADRICTYFKEKDIRKITSLDIQKYLLSLRTTVNEKHKPFSAKTIKHHYCVLSLIFRFALDNEIIIKNPIAKVKSPRLERKKVTAFTKEEAQKMLFFLQGCDLEFQCMMLFMLTLGLRRGEMIGLIWDDLDLDRGVVSINRSVSHISGYGTIVDVPKTENSVRVLPIPQMLLSRVKIYKSTCADVKESYFVFPSEIDPLTPRDPDSVTRRVKRFMERVGLPDMSPHDLRHSCATLLLQSGADIKSVQEIMGHSDPMTTLKYYVKTDVDQMRKATRVFEESLGEKGEY